MPAEPQRRARRRRMPEPIPDTPENVARAILTTLSLPGFHARNSSGYFPGRLCSDMAPSTQGTPEPAQYPVRLTPPKKPDEWRFAQEGDE